MGSKWLHETFKNTELSAVSWSYNGSKTAENQKQQRKTHIFGDHRIISALRKFFYNSPYPGNVIQVNIYRYKKAYESIKSGKCFSSIFSSYFSHLSFIRVGSGTLSIS